MPDSPVTVQMLAIELRNHVEECGKQSERTQRALDSLVDRWDNLGKSAWKAIGTVALAIFVAFLGVAFQNWQFHSQTVAAVSSVATNHSDGSDAQLRAIKAEVDQLTTAKAK